MISKLYSALVLKFISLGYERSNTETSTSGSSEYPEDKK